MIAERQGDLTQRLGYRKDNEVGEMCQSFNSLLKRLSGIISGIAQSAENLAAASTQVLSSSEMMATSAEEVAAQAATVAVASEEMVATANEVAAGRLAEMARELQIMVSHFKIAS
ncbi:MAG: methyl-accepting chemotaxis protein [Geobacteraceae bacterium]|nr:methyl-accepting chemotaxis protein [Geobacteraceae bacterium]